MRDQELYSRFRKETGDDIIQTSTVRSVSLTWSLSEDESVSLVSELELLLADAAFMGVTMGIFRCDMMRSMFISMDLRQSLSCSACALDTRLLGEVSFSDTGFLGAFLTLASSVSISTLVGLLSSSIACRDTIESKV